MAAFLKQSWTAQIADTSRQSDIQSIWLGRGFLMLRKGAELIVISLSNSKCYCIEVTNGPVCTNTQDAGRSMQTRDANENEISCSDRQRPSCQTLLCVHGDTDCIKHVCFYRATANAYARSCCRQLSVRSLSNAWIVTKRTKVRMV